MESNLKKICSFVFKQEKYPHCVRKEITCENTSEWVSLLYSCMARSVNVQ